MHKKEKRITDPELTKQLAFYKRFLPTELFLESAITGLNEYEIKAAVLNLNITDFQNTVRFHSTPDIYALVNELVSLCIPVIYEYGGTVYEFIDAGFGALFIDDPPKALKSVLCVFGELQRKAGGFQYWNSISAGFAYGSVMAGIVGHEKRMSPLILSVYTGLSRHLQEMGTVFGSKILVTGTFAEGVPEFNRQYNQRLLGYQFIKNGAFIEKIYDVFDGDLAEVRNRKRKTKLAFEKGVRLFSEGNCERARYYFIEVLKTDWHDKAAKTYVQLCERQAGAKERDGIYIDVY